MVMETLSNSLCGRIAIAETPRGTRNLNIFLYMPWFLRSVRVSSKWQTLHSISNFAAQRITRHFLRERV